MNCNVCNCKTCKYNNRCEYPAYYNCSHYIPNNENNTKTNGDMIKALFDCKIVEETPSTYVFEIEKDWFVKEFEKEWWNAPYKENKENSRTERRER